MNILPKKLINKYIITDAKRRMADWRELNGCSRAVDAAYNGYTGVKIYRFPTSDSARFYPDVTKDFDKMKFNLLKDIEKAKREPFGRLKIIKMFLNNFSTGEIWDTKFIAEFPGRDKFGRVQFARYNGKIVAGNFLSNNIYGFLCAAAGIPESVSKFIARVYSKGFMEPLISGKLPDKTLLSFNDPIADQLAISSGYSHFRKLKKK